MTLQRLGSLAWPEVAERAGRSVLAVPVGSTEQHGPHLAISTDTDVAVALCERLAGEVPDVLVAPPVCYGSSGEHREYAGTLSIGQQALELVLVELCRSADAFSGVVIVSAHGGNRDAVTRAVSALRSEGRRVCSWSPSGGDPCDSHAGRIETSVQLALHPELVKLDHVRAGNVQPLTELMPVLREAGVAAVSPTGVLGDPTEASATLGEQILAAWTADLVSSVRREWELALR